MKKKKVLFISSTGGHLEELTQLKSMFDKYDYYIVTEKTKSNLSLKNKYPNRVSYLIYGSYTTLGKKFMSGKSFSVWLNNDYLPNHQEYSWIREVSSKSVKHSIEDACTAFSRFFHH